MTRTAEHVYNSRLSGGLTRGTDVPSAQQEAREQAWVPAPHEDAVGPGRAVEPPQEGAQASHCPDTVQAPGRLTAERLPKAFRITRAAELRALLTEGKRRRTDHLDLFTRPSPLGHSRLAVIVPRFAHSAPQRNRLRRRVREICRRAVLPVLPSPLDVAVRARPGAYDARFELLRAEIVGVLCPSSPGSPS